MGREIYVVSDLHLGGEYASEDDKTGRGFRMCTRTTELESFIRFVIQRRLTIPDVELVINGDFLDFLAEKVTSLQGNGVSPEWTPLVEDEGQAVVTLRCIASRDGIIFVALRDLLDAGCRLTLVLGNHDIELAFPAVREALVDLLGADGRAFRFVCDGEAYRVGKLLIEHGNQYDRWNAIRYDDLGRLRSAQSRRLAPDTLTFRPPAGSELVARVTGEETRRPT